MQDIHTSTRTHECMSIHQAMPLSIPRSPPALQVAPSTSNLPVAPTLAGISKSNNASLPLPPSLPPLTDLPVATISSAEAIRSGPSVGGGTVMSSTAVRVREPEAPLD